MDAQVVAALVLGTFTFAGATIACAFTYVERKLDQRIGKPNGKGNVIEAVEGLYELMQPITESQYEVLDRVSRVEDRLTEHQVADHRVVDRRLAHLEHHAGIQA